MSGCNEERRCPKLIRCANGAPGLRGPKGARGPQGEPGANAMTDMAKMYTAYTTTGVSYTTATATNTPVTLALSTITPITSTSIGFTNGTANINLAPGNYMVSYSVTFTAAATGTTATVVPFALTLAGGILAGSEHAENITATANAPIDNVSVTIPVVVTGTGTSALNLVIVGTGANTVVVNAATVSVFKLGNIGS